MQAQVPEHQHKMMQRRKTDFRMMHATPQQGQLTQAAWATADIGSLSRLSDDLLLLVLSALSLSDICSVKSSCARLLLLARQTLQAPSWRRQAGNLRALQEASWREHHVDPCLLPTVRAGIADEPLSAYNQRLLLAFWSGGDDPGPDPTIDLRFPTCAGSPGKRALVLPFRLHRTVAASTTGLP